jgi:uncharacterized membrane-anchored protein YhcB (DUF1043 family)
VIQYLRIPKNKFWGWVFSSLAVGLLLGGVAAWVVARTGSTKEVGDLKQQLASQSAQAASQQQQLQARLDSSDASLTALSQQYDTLKATADAAKKATTTKTSTSSDSSNTAALEVLSRTVTPSTITSGDYITMTAKVSGSATKVTMRITSVSSGDATTYSLKKSSTNGSNSTWTSSVRFRKPKGTYRYYATVYSKSDSATMPGAKVSSFKVE